MAYTLYKNPVEPGTLAIVQYLHAEHGVLLVPAVVVERRHPAHVRALPAILDHATGRLHQGLAACEAFYAERTRVPDLLRHALAFKQARPGYRIHGSG